MRPRIEAVLQAILNADASTTLSTSATGLPACRSCQDVLHAYIDAELDGKDAIAVFPAVKLHLGQCPECEQEYTELKALLLMERQGAFAQPPIEPAFDFAYLETAPRRRAIWESIELAGQEITRLFAEVRVRVGRRWASFDPLPRPLAPQWVAVPITREKAAEAKGQAQALPLPSPEHDVSLSLTVGPVSGDEAALGVQITRISTGQPLSRARVTMRDEERRVLISELTHEDGRVTFPHIGSGTYLVEVKHQGHAWELPMTFTLEENVMDARGDS